MNLNLDTLLSDAEALLQSVSSLRQVINEIPAVVKANELQQLVTTLRDALTGREYDAAYTEMRSHVKALVDDYKGSWFWDKLSGVVMFYDENLNVVRKVSLVDTPEVTEFLNE